MGLAVPIVLRGLYLVALYCNRKKLFKKKKKNWIDGEIKNFFLVFYGHCIKISGLGSVWCVLYSYPCLLQVEKDVAEKEVQRAELLSHHRSRNCKQNHFNWVLNSNLNSSGVYYTSNNYLPTTCVHGQQIQLEGIFALTCVSYCALSKPNKAPAKLNLLTCQVKPSLEDKKCFDLISRK